MSTITPISMRMRPTFAGAAQAARTVTTTEQMPPLSWAELFEVCRTEVVPDKFQAIKAQVDRQAKPNISDETKIIMVIKRCVERSLFDLDKAHRREYLSQKA